LKVWQNVLLFVLAFFVVPSSNTVCGQISTASSTRVIPSEVKELEDRISHIIASAEEHFRTGKLNLQQNQREKARKNFDTAIDTILESGLDARASQRLQTYYLELVERIYREEVPLRVPGSANSPIVGFTEQKNQQPPIAAWSQPISAPEPSQKKDPEILSSQFPPSDPVEMYRTLKNYQFKLQKDQFETTQNFKGRLQSLLPQIKIGPSNAADRFAFTVFADDQKYNADTQTFSFKLEYTSDYAMLMGLEAPEELIKAFDRAETAEESSQDEFSKRLNAIGGDDFLRLQLRGTRRVLGSRVGKTAMGIRFRYSIASYTSIHLVMRKTNLYPVYQQFRIVLPTDIARRTVGNLAIRIVGRLRFPFFSEYTGYEVANLSDREESHYTKFFLYLEPDALIFFDSRSGETLTSLPLPLKLPQKQSDPIVLTTKYFQPNSRTTRETRTALTEKEKAKTWIELKDGTRLEVDEAWEQGDDVWLRKGSVTLRIERSRVKEIVRKTSSN
jgi:hypothetical protein